MNDPISPISPASQPPLHCPVAIVGAGPAGLMAAEVLSAAGLKVHLFDAMPTVGRKLLLAGIGGLNLTHAEPLPAFKARYGARAADCGRCSQARSKGAAFMSRGNTRCELPTKVSMPSPAAQSRSACGPKTSSQRPQSAARAP